MRNAVFGWQLVIKPAPGGLSDRGTIENAFEVNLQRLQFDIFLCSCSTHTLKNKSLQPDDPEPAERAESKCLELVR